MEISSGIPAAGTYQGKKKPDEDAGVFVHKRDEDKLDLTYTTMEAMDVGVVFAETLKSSPAMEAMKGAIGMVSGPYFTVQGVRDLKDAIKEKSTLEIVGASSTLASGASQTLWSASRLVGLRPVAAAVGPTIAAALQGPVVSAISDVAFNTFGVAELGIGGYKIYKGIKKKDKSQIIKGALQLGMGAAVTAAFSGGGLVAGVALLALYGVSLWMDRKEVAKASKIMMNEAKRILTGGGKDHKIPKSISLDDLDKLKLNSPESKKT